MPSVLSNAQNTHISGGSFTNVGGNLVLHGQGKLSVFDILRERSAPSALLDSNERFNPPRCAEETRQEIIQYIIDWIEDDEESATMLWIFGAAGAGKTALCQTIGEIYQRKARLAGTFFFSRTATTVERNDGNRLIPTLGLQLAEALPQARKQIEKILARDPDLFAKSRRTQMDKLFIQPLQSRTTRAFIKKMIGSMPPPYLVIIDGLDECHDPDVQYDLLRIIASSLPHLRYPLRFLVSSRAESNIVRMFNHDRALLLANSPRIDLGEDRTAGEAIRKYLMRQFDEVKRIHPLRNHLDPYWPSQAILQHLVDKSSTQFIYPSTVMRYIQEPRARPDERLDIILGKCPPPMQDKPFAALDALYIHVFSNLQDHQHRQLIQTIGVIFLALSDMPQYRYLKASPAQLEDYLNLRPGDMTMLLDDFQSLISLPSNRLEPIRVLHVSLFDFFLDKSRSEHLYMDLGFAHQILAEHNLRQWQGRVTQMHDRQCFRFLLHCHAAHLPETLMANLQSFSELYKNVLGNADPSSLETFLFLPFIFQLFFSILLRQGFTESLTWHTLHAKRIKKQLQSVLGARLASKSSKMVSPTNFVRVVITTLIFISSLPLQSQIIYQSQHEVYETLAMALFLNSNQAAKASRHLRFFYSCYTLASKYLEQYKEMQIAMKHLLLSCLPHFESDAMPICILYASIIRHDLKYGDEVDEMLRERVVEYLRRVQTEVKHDEMHTFLRVWGLNTDYEWIPATDDALNHHFNLPEVEEKCEFDEETSVVA
ncbi:hypothetical protein CPB83DRAFT_849519 [Crepidotus variabilis]|uniref:NACHT domain-containing protein n=1 Tax=Crepidotus variabilis TaxID=179855 RepID=A0A9P6EK23_9AGAR|nr:hypothetical protein CPB83DRAFT_849519 [Crepidotus variabilis]